MFDAHGKQLATPLNDLQHVVAMAVHESTHYAADGGAVNVNRDPRDGLLDVFVEDDFNNRIFWYRVDNRNTETLSGTINKP